MPSPQPVALLDSSSPNRDTDAGEGAAALPSPPKSLKICCACPETKMQRDECVVKNGPDACQKYIEAHKACLRAEGFKV